MISKLLVAVDGTEAARSALRWAADLVVREELSGRQVSVAMINVWKPRETIGVDGFGLLANGGASDAAEKLLEELTGDVVAEYPRASDIEHVVRSGFAGSAILAEARKRDVDMIVVGTRAEGPIRQTLTGSVSQWVSSDGERTVAVVPAGAEPLSSPTVVGFDGSSGSIEALRWAVANCPGAIHVITVADSTDTTDATERGREQLSRVEASLAGTDRSRVQASIVEGDPVRVLAGGELDASQVVVGARSTEHFEQSIWGSVTTHLVATAPRPVVVVPPAVSPSFESMVAPLASESRFGQV